MPIEEELDPSEELTDGANAAGSRSGFVSGFMLGVLVGAGFALLFAPEQGDKTRGRLRKRIRSLSEEAREGIDRAGNRTRKELLRRQRRLKAELRRVRERTREALE